MTTTAIVSLVAVCLTIAGVVAAACVHLDRRDGRGAPPILERFMVNVGQPDDLTFRGLLVTRGHRWVVLDNAELLQGDGTWTQIDGRQYVPSARVVAMSKL